MPKQTFHFLNVREGDCSVIEHASGHVSVIDVCNARSDMAQEEAKAIMEKGSKADNYNQKDYPANPINYLNSLRVNEIFRFIATHPDMDHLDGLKDIFEEFEVVNFHDTNNKEEKDFDGEYKRFREEDWEFYKNLRDSDPNSSPKRLLSFSDDDKPYLTRNWDRDRPGDALYILSPTPQLVDEANKTSNYNDLSYVILYKSQGGFILFTGDSNDNTWEHLLENHEADLTKVDLLIAPHHGRKSDRNYEFLDVVEPKRTFFGNAASKDLAYDNWYYRDLKYITNNQAGSIIVDTSGYELSIYVANEGFAKDRNPDTFYSDKYKGWFFENIS